MLLNQLIIWLGICLLICASIFLWIKWRKIGTPLLVLIIITSFIYSFGITKYSILGSMRLNATSIVIDLAVDSESVSRGKAIFDSLKSWSKILRGKKPIYISTGGSQILVDTIGDEKSIKLFKRF